MLTITVTDFRGCAKAQIVCDPIALVGGLNAAGKSSLAQGVAATLTGQMIPVAGLGRSSGGALVRSGSARGLVEIVGENGGTARGEWPAAQRVEGGDAPTASEYATGLQSIAAVNFSAKDRLRVLAEYLHAEPTREDLATALAATDLVSTETVVEAVWSLIEQQGGWDPAERVRRDRGAELKGQWRQVTGHNYGSRVAAAYRPDLAELREADLSAAVHQAEAARDQAIAAQAVSADERRRCEEETGELTERGRLRDQALGKLEAAERAYKRAQQDRQALPPATGEHTLPCPYCAQPIVVHRDLAETRLTQAQVVTQLDDKELKRRRMAIATADGDLEHANHELTAARRLVDEARRLVEASESARERLANWPRAVEAGTDLESAKAMLGEAQQRLTEYRQKRQADEIHGKIEGNEIIIGLLAGDGLRAMKLARVLDVFVSQTLAALCRAAGWAPVTIRADDGAVSYDDRIYGLLSSSEQYRVRAVLAVAMAQLDGSDLVVFDGADILDAPSRGGLVDLVTTADIPALICLTLPRREMLPDLAAEGLGQSYWLSGGTVHAIERVAA